MLSYTRKLILNKTQKIRIDNWIGVCRLVYNMGLEIRISAWRNKHQSVSKADLSKQLTTIKDIDWVADVPAMSLQSVLERLDNAYRTFYRGGGFPKWANKRKYNSILFKQHHNGIRAANNYITIPKMGALKIFKDSKINGNIKIATIKKDGSDYFIRIVTDAKKDIQNKDESQVIGLDMGIAYLYVDSNGEFVSNPRHYKKYEKQIRVENRSLERKNKYSKSWEKQVKRLSRLHRKIKNCIRDFLHKVSTKIAKENYTVILENLNIDKLSKSKRLSKHILDCGWGIFSSMLKYKTNVITISPKHTSQTCSSCGIIDAKSRISQSKFVCTNCGEIVNADVNAAKNIKSKGIAFVRQREAVACA